MSPLLEFQDEFLQDLVSFLESRGHNRLVPPAGLDAFPEVVLNGKRLDLYNLYKEVSLCNFVISRFRLLLPTFLSFLRCLTEASCLKHVLYTI